ncbi:MAG TPA: hypothetical protein VNA11_13670 [Pseudonocardia sp.]|nr:hypothetical protein [Pseudonocardia sp.]
MASSDGLWALAALGLALVAAQGSVAGADTTPVASVLRQQIGQSITMNNVYVSSVPADEGFWVDSDHGRMWVQIETVVESPYDVDAGDTVSFSGRVVAHGPEFPTQVGVTSGEGATGLAGAGAHISIPLNGLAFVNTGI